MKNLYSKNEFLTLKQDDILLNEGFLGKMFKSLWNSTVKLANKICIILKNNCIFVLSKLIKSKTIKNEIK